MNAHDRFTNTAHLHTTITSNATHVDPETAFLYSIAHSTHSNGRWHFFGYDELSNTTLASRQRSHLAVKRSFTIVPELTRRRDFHSTIAGPVMMRNTPPPLASNDLLN